MKPNISRIFECLSGFLFAERLPQHDSFTQPTNLLASFSHRPLRRQTLREQMNLGLKAKVLFRELPNHLVRFNELLLLARWRSLSEGYTYSSGRYWNEANQFSRSQAHDNHNMPKSSGGSIVLDSSAILIVQ